MRRIFIISQLQRTHSGLLLVGGLHCYISVLLSRAAGRGLSLVGGLRRIFIVLQLQRTDSGLSLVGGLHRSVSVLLSRSAGIDLWLASIVLLH